MEQATGWAHVSSATGWERSTAGPAYMDEEDDAGIAWGPVLLVVVVVAGMAWAGWWWWKRARERRQGEGPVE